MSEEPRFDAALFGKYNVPGPRYTSYPTVPYWSDSPTEAQWLAAVDGALTRSEAEGIGAAIYVHVPFCRSLCTYCGCHKRISRGREVVEPYLAAVLAEWRLYLERLGRPITIAELHLGGGTPTFLAPDELARLVEGLIAPAKVAPDAEFSVEADPRVTTTEHLTTLARLGFRRLSLGIQDFDPAVQDIVARVQSPEMVARVVDEARAAGYTSLNYDLIYGLPLQSRASIERTVEVVRAHRPDRIAFYGYAHVPWIKPSQRRFTEADLPSGDDKRALYELGRTVFEAAGYREIGMDHFALESDSLWQAVGARTLHRNFMGYTSRQVAPLIGLGASSIGDAWTAFAQNEKHVETYQEMVGRGELPLTRGHVLTEEDLVLRRHVLQLMTRFATAWSEPALHTAHLDSVADRLNELRRDGLIEVAADRVTVTTRGRPFLRNVCMAFDARLVRQAPATQLFSQTV